MVIYLDELLVRNFTADYLLLLTSARLLGEPMRRKQFALAAIFGALYAAATVLLGGVLTSWMGKLLAAMAMVRIAFGRCGRTVRQWLLFLLLSCGFAGVEMALAAGGAFSLPLFAGSFALSYLLLGVSFRSSARAAVRGELLCARIICGGRSLRLTALHDSGCTLTGVDGAAVLVVQRRALQPLFPGGEPPTELELPFTSLGGAGTLRAFRADALLIGRQRYEGAIIAVYEGSLGGSHQALWGGETEGSEVYARDRMAEGVAAAAGVAADAAGMVHRRERHPAAAADARGGSGAADAAGRGGGA